VNVTHPAVRLMREDELLRLLQAGCTLKEAALHLRLSFPTLKKYVSQPEFLDRLKALNEVVFAQIDAELKTHRQDMYKRLEEASEIALEEMIKLATSSSSDGIRLKAAQDLMDRDPKVSRTRRLEANTNQRFINPLVLQTAANVIDIEDRFHAAREVEQITDGDSEQSS